jgi:hypothetical protein
MSTGSRSLFRTPKTERWSGPAKDDVRGGSSSPRRLPGIVASGNEHWRNPKICRSLSSLSVATGLSLPRRTSRQSSPIHRPRGAAFADTMEKGRNTDGRLTSIIWMQAGTGRGVCLARTGKVKDGSQDSDRGNSGISPAYLDSEIRSPDGHRYVVKLDHRSLPSEHKSAWLISVEEEVACFDKALASGWTVRAIGWGLHLAGQKSLVLGENHVRKLKIGKFVSNPPNILWHGYPADYRSKLQDRPPIAVLSSWRDAGIIKKHEMTRVRRGKPCCLSD